MSFVHDRTSIGDFIAQHHDLSGNWTAEPNRRRQGRLRFLGYDKITGDPIYDRLGWDHGGVCWLPSWLGQNLSIGIWQQAFPALIMPAALGTQSGPKYDSKVVGPLALPALKQSNGIWVVDRGLQAQPGAVPMGLDLPTGFPVVALGMSTMDEQQLALVPSGGILIAVKNGAGQGRFGTRVYDVTKDGVLDVMRWARDHSHWCVYLLPNSAPVGFRFAGAGTAGKTVEKIGLVPPGGLAWELGPTVDGNAGHGVVTDIPSKAGTPAPAILDGPVSLVNLTNNASPLVANPGQVTGSLGSGGSTVSKPIGTAPKTREKPQSGGKTVAGAPPILAVSSYRGRGPLNVGQADDPHQLAVTPDGKPINSLHEDEGAIVIGDTGDAPRKHDAGAWQSVSPAGPFAHEVFHRTDPSDSHEWMGKTIPGLRKWQGTSAESVPTPRGDVFPGLPINPGGGTQEKKKGGGPIGGGPAGPGGPGGPPGPGGGPPGGGGDPPGGGGLTPPVVPPVLPPDVGPQKIGPDHLIVPFPLPINPGDGPIPPGGYFDGTGRPLYPEYPPPQVPDVGDVGEDKFQPGEEVGTDAVEPVNPGGVTDGPVQRSYPARGLALGFHELIPRAVALDPNNRDPRYQFDPYTPSERAAFDNAPAGARIAGFSEQSGGVPTLDGPACGPANIGTGTSPRGGLSIGPSDFDLTENLKRRQRGLDPLRPRNEALITFEERADAAWGDTLENGKPANGFRIGRSWDELTELLYMSIDQTQGDGSLVDGPPAILVDFVNEIVELWGSPILTTAAASALNGVYGDGADGDAVCDGAGAVTGMTGPSASRYTLNRDVCYEDITLSAGVTVVTNGFVLRARSGTIPATAVIGNSGGNGGNAVITIGGAAGTSGGAGSLPGGKNGTAGGNSGVAGSNGISSTNSLGGAGGGGGGGGAGGTTSGGAATAPAANMGTLRALPQGATGQFAGSGASTPTWATGGGSGGGGAGSLSLSAGGGGGGAGGPCVVIIADLDNQGVIESNGGNGGNASNVAGDSGGGGAGGAGFVILITGESSTTGTVNVNGGTGGNGHGVGLIGANGANGIVIYITA